MIIRFLSYAIAFYCMFAQQELIHKREIASEIFVHNRPDDNGFMLMSIAILFAIFSFLAASPTFFLGNKKLRKQLAAIKIYFSLPLLIIISISYLTVIFNFFIAVSTLIYANKIDEAVYSVPLILVLSIFLTTDVIRLIRHFKNRRTIYLQRRIINADN